MPVVNRLPVYQIYIPPQLLKPHHSNTLLAHLYEFSWNDLLFFLYQCVKSRAEFTSEIPNKLACNLVSRFGKY